MSASLAFVPLLVTLGVFLIVSPWVDPQASSTRKLWHLATLALVIRYAAYRLFMTWPPLEPTFACAFKVFYLLVELGNIYLLVGTVGGKLRFSETRSRTTDADRLEGWWGAAPPLVDVLIPTYNESARVLEKTFAGVARLDYPRYRVWVLDDGKRNWLARWTAERGFGYLRRSSNRFYKAGNLNEALTHIFAGEEAPEFIAVFDADFVPRPRFLRRVLALMGDGEVGVVQTPQHFYNPDPYQHAVGSTNAWPDDQRLVFDCQLPAQDSAHQATCCGTSFLVRVCALRAIGLFPTESVCEDTLMSIKLAAIGFKTAYLNESVSVGLNPDGIKELLTQRARWAQGQVEIAYSAWGSLHAHRGLLGHLAAWRDSFKWAFVCASTLFGLSIPIVYWLTGTFAIETMPQEIVYYGGPLWVEGAIFAWMTGGRHLPLFAQAAEAVTAFAVVPSTYQAFRHPGGHPFRVTAKGVNRNRVTVHWRLTGWFVGGLALLWVGMVVALADPHSAPCREPFLEVGLFFSLQTLVILILVILVTVELPKYRQEERFACRENVEVSCNGETLAATMVDVSPDGAALRCTTVPPSGTPCHLTLAGVGRFAARVVRPMKRDGFALRFDLTPPERDRLVAEVFCSEKYVRPLTGWSFGACLRAAMRRAFAGA